jgi:hypothetical protein
MTAFFDPPPEPEPALFGPPSRRGGGWHASQWVWPLPPPGPVAFVCEWPVAGIPESRAEIDAQVILDAASRAQVIFSDDDLPPWPDDDDEDDGPEVVRIR